jgi:methylaspartate mutase epsilon subunit
MAAFPPRPDMAAQLIHQSAVTAALSGATRLITKTPVEAVKLPTLRDNLEGLQINFAGVSAAKDETVDEARVAAECEIIRREVQAIFDGVVMAAHGNVANGIVKAFEQGLLDIPFSPSVHNRGDVLTARDTTGAVRFLRCGRLPFDRDLRDFHAEAMAARLREEALTPGRDDHLLVERDVLRVARGNYDRWPLGK